VFNSPSANRRLAIRTVTVQAAVATAVALGFLAVGRDAALAAALSGGAVVVGSLVLAWRAMFGPPRSGGDVLARLVSGLLLKWFVVIVALYVGLARLGLPPLPLLVGLGLTLAASFPTHALKS
jgi:F0F1-type ATP synthase assembly protein I